MTSTRVGVLGLGRMGLPIARGLADAGFDVTGHDPDSAASQSAVDAGLTVTADPTLLAADSDVLVTVLPGSAELAALYGWKSALGALRPGSTWVDLTSADPRVVERVAGGVGSRGIHAVGAAMGGGVDAARERRLHFFVGGAAEDVARVAPVLDALGSTDHVGEWIGAGHTAKLLANLLWFGQVVAVSEAMLLGQSLGIEPARLRDTLAASAGGSRFIDDSLDALLAGDYLEHFGLDRVLEELEILEALAADADVPFELSATVVRLHRDALARFGAVDGELLVAKLLEERAGRRLRG